MPHPQVGEATALVKVGEVAGELNGMRLVDVDVRSGARRRAAALVRAFFAEWSMLCGCRVLVSY